MTGPEFLDVASKAIEVAALIYYAGKQQQRVEDHERRIGEVEKTTKEHGELLLPLIGEHRAIHAECSER